MDQGDRIGMVLDLDQGSMTVWKNDEKLGVMVAEGLRGSLCWAVEIHDPGHSVRMSLRRRPLRRQSAGSGEGMASPKWAAAAADGD